MSLNLMKFGSANSRAEAEARLADLTAAALAEGLSPDCVGIVDGMVGAAVRGLAAHMHGATPDQLLDMMMGVIDGCVSAFATMATTLRLPPPLCAMMREEIVRKINEATPAGQMPDPAAVRPFVNTAPRR